MALCLSPEQLARYRDRRVESPEELETIHTHLALCPACREALRAPGETTAVASAPRRTLFGGEAACPDNELLLRYVEGEANTADVEIVETHREDCSRCAAALASLQAFRAEMQNYDWETARAIARPPSWRTRWRGWLAVPSMPRFALVTGGAAALSGWLVFWTTTRPLNSRLTALENQQGRIGQENAALKTDNAALNHQVVAIPALKSQIARLQEEAQRLRDDIASRPQSGQTPLGINDGGRQVVLDRQGRVGRVEWLPSAVKEALRTQRLQTPRVIAMLNPGDSELRGEQEARAGFTLRAPVGTVVLSDRPAFSWTAAPGATRYKLTLADAASDTPDTQEVTGATWTPTKPLSRGHIYTWEVVAIRSGQEMDKAPPPVKFKVLEPEKAAEIARAQRAYAASPLTMAVLYAEAGLLDDAEQALRELAKANPGSARVRNLRKTLQTLRRHAP